MKKISLILLVLVIGFALAGCASKQPTVGSASDVPPWLNDIAPDDVIWGIGQAKQSSVSMSMTIAESRARAGIARELQTKVQQMIEDYNMDAGNAKNQANASMQQNIMRQVVNIDVSGARIVQRWQGRDGTWWFKAEMKKADARKNVASILGNEEAAYSQFKAQEALKMLDAQLDKKTKPVVVDN